jgi:hypothetical protein
MVMNENQHSCLRVYDRNNSSMHPQRAPDAWHHASSISRRTSSAGVWASDSPHLVGPMECITFEMPGEAGPHLPRDSAESRETRHDILAGTHYEGLEYIMLGPPFPPRTQPSSPVYTQLSFALLYKIYVMDVSDSFVESWLDIAQMDVQQESLRHS